MNTVFHWFTNLSRRGVQVGYRGRGFTCGRWRSTASGKFATAMGRESTASGEYSTAMGYKSTASGQQSTAMGRLSTAGNWATAMGEETTASGVNSMAMGFSTTASGDSSTAIQYALQSHSSPRKKQRYTPSCRALTLAQIMVST